MQSQGSGPLYAKIDDLLGVNLYISFGLFCVRAAGQRTRLRFVFITPSCFMRVDCALHGGEAK